MSDHDARVLDRRRPPVTAPGRSGALVVVVPVFNEAATVADVVARALAHAPVLVVDDGSTDDGGERARRAGAEVLRHEHRHGKGQAIRTGLAAAADRGAVNAITLDGDGQHDPCDIPVLRAAADREPGALVIGGRLGRARELERGRLSAIRVAGFFLNWVTGLRIEDSQSGFRLYPLALVRALGAHRGGFVFETEVLVEAARQGVPVREVAVSVAPRRVQRSRFRPFGDGTRIGVYLAGRALARWAVELRDGLGAVAAVLSRERRVARHEALLIEAAGYRDTPGLWASAIGAGAARFAGARLALWWRHPRRRRATAAAVSVTLLPAVATLALVQTLVDRLGRRAPDVVTPLVERWYAQARLVALEPEVTPAAGAAVVIGSHDGVVIGGVSTTAGVRPEW